MVQLGMLGFEDDDGLLLLFLFFFSPPFLSTLPCLPPLFPPAPRGGQGRRASVVASKRLRSSARRGRGGEAVLHPVVRSRFGIGARGV